MPEKNKQGLPQCEAAPVVFRKGVYRNRFFDGDFEQLEPENEEIVITDLCLSKIKLYEHYAQQEPTEQDSRNIELLKNWVNNILLQKKYHGNPNAYRADLSDEITIKAKEVYKESWKDSDIRESLNEMRSYVRRQNNRFTWNEILTSSIAAVIAKGDDWKKLLTFMQSKMWATPFIFKNTHIMKRYVSTDANSQRFCTRFFNCPKAC